MKKLCGMRDFREKRAGMRDQDSSFQRVTLASGLFLAGRQKITRVYKQNFTGRVTPQPCAVALKGSENN